MSSFLLYTTFHAILTVYRSTTTTSDLSSCIPTGLFANCLFILQLIFWASFEEFLYRVYFPNKLEFFFLSSNPYLTSNTVFNSTNYVRPCILVIPHFLFAIAHSHRGLLNVLFAFFASIFFRKLYVCFSPKIGSILSFAIICAIHSFFNIYTLYFILKF